jgi:hypothetical protein
MQSSAEGLNSNSCMRIGGTVASKICRHRKLERYYRPARYNFYRLDLVPFLVPICYAGSPGPMEKPLSRAGSSYHDTLVHPALMGREESSGHPNPAEEHQIAFPAGRWQSRVRLMLRPLG